MSFASRHFRLLLVLVWIVLLVGIWITPFASESPTLGDDLTRHTVRLSLLYYGIAATLMLLCHSTEWYHCSGQVRSARCAWTLACLAYLVHLAMAFHFYHGWSHADAVRHTQEVSGFGPGIYLSHVFTICWSADVLTWWWRPAYYSRRGGWIRWCLHTFMLFIIFNATIVYESGFIRYAGCVLFLELLAVAWYSRWSARTASLPPERST
jgi:hypothetical protein